MYAQMTSRSTRGFSLALLLAMVLLTGFRSRPLAPVTMDLSTPELSYQSLVVALKSSDADALKNVATPTGISSLLEASQLEDFKQGLPHLGEDLENASITWDAITDEIYVAKASADGHVHKMEFTREEPGWMLYHWQLGGGVK
jgi:hypothetical protein